MKNCTIQFNTTNRNQLYNYFKRFGAELDIDSLTGNAPFLADIQGDKNAGKSLIWDALKEGMLGESAQLDEAHSFGVPGYRVYETWHGEHISDGTPLKLFFCNRGGLKAYGDPMGAENIIANDNQDDRREQLGNVILLLNSQPIACDLEIELLARNQESLQDWQRSCSIVDTHPQAGAVSIYFPNMDREY